jgi:tRNA pseudouridine55 synthase
MTKINGWIILDKPLKLGSTQAVGAVKRNLREAGLMGKGKDKTKVGHGGTLDPLATGVLPIGIGEATKLCGQMLDASKLYDFTIGFGIETDTLDAEGVAVAESAHWPTLGEVEAVLPQFTGTIEQMPPAYSALKVDGRRAYDLARAGEAVALKTRSVTVSNLHIRHPELVSGSQALLSARSGTPEILKQVQDDEIEGEGWSDDDPLPAITLTAHVSKGTYIRSLARDIARALDSVGHVTMLRRTRAGPFGLTHAISLDKLNEIGQGAALEDIILPLEAGLDDIPALSLDPDQARRLRQGQVMSGIAKDNGRYWAREGNGTPLALVELEDGNVRVIRGFNM